MNGSQANTILRPYLERLGLAPVKSFEVYRTRYPHRPIHRRTTTANVLCDEVWADIVNAFVDDEPQVRPILHPHGLRLLGIQGPSGEIEILLWFKKVRGTKPRCYPTASARNRLSGGNFEMFKRATVLVVGYQLNREETRIIRVSIFPPSMGTPEWIIDLNIDAAGAVATMPGGVPQRPARPRVVVRRIDQRRLIE